MTADDITQLAERIAREHPSWSLQLPLIPSGYLDVERVTRKARDWRRYASVAEYESENPQTQLF